MSSNKEELLVTLTVTELRGLVRDEIAAAIARLAEVREVLTLEQAAELLQLNPQVLAKNAEKMGVPSHKIGPQWRFIRSELLAWLAGKRAA
jgi:excisionase family DNA binding protein